MTNEADTMRPLLVISQRSFHARSSARTLGEAIVRVVPSPKLLAVATLALPLMVVPARRPEAIAVDTTAPAGAAARAPTRTASIPRLVSASLPSSADNQYAFDTPNLGGDGAQPRSDPRTVADAWSAAFYGDRQRLTAFIENTAVAYGLSPDFLMRLLRQESHLNYQAVSRTGAQGVAQFMPATASERGLADPFNPFEAIPHAASLLKAYRARFGSLGLAAAAYNGGPRRVSDWLSGRGALPGETRDYVVRITGRTADDWRTSGDAYAEAGFRLPDLRN